MTTHPELFAALDMAVFERGPDGSFAAIGRVPDWVQTLCADLTFPFLGTFLETATKYWSTTRPGCLWSGLCEETDSAGQVFHFEVAAANADKTHFLVFERRPEIEAMQSVLQRARELALGEEKLVGRLDNLRQTQAGALSGLAAMANNIAAQAAALQSTPLSDAQRPIAQQLQAVAAQLQAGIDTTLRSIGKRGPG